MIGRCPAPARCASPSRAVTVDPASPAAVRVSCPIGVTTRIVFPWPSRVSVSAGGREALGIEVESLREGKITVTPADHPGEALVSIRGLNGEELTLKLYTTRGGVASEIRLTVRSSTAVASSGEAVPRRQSAPPSRPGPLSPESPASDRQSAPAASAPPSLAPAPSPPSSAAPGPSPGPTLPASPEAALLPDANPSVLPSRSLDIEELLTLRPEEIGRREGLPGELPVVLEDALKSPRNVWLRFRVEGGARRTLKKVEWERGQVKEVLASAEGRDLRVIVRLPRGEVTRRTRVTLELSDGVSYKFALSAPWFSSFVKGLLF